MVDVSKLDAKELNELMEKCRVRQAELKRENISSMQEEAVKNIGRCFKIGTDYVKIIGVPEVELTKTDIIYNPYQYPALRLGSNPDFTRHKNPFPFYYGHLHSSAWRGGYDKFFHTQITEIDLAEFIKEWQRRIDDFTMKYVSDVIEGVNCGRQDC